MAEKLDSLLEQVERREGDYLVALEQAREQVTEMRDMVMTALNSGKGDTEWSTLVDLGDMLGLDYNEDSGRYYAEGGEHG